MLFPLKDRLVGGTRERLLVLLGAVALVLLIACVNVANLLLARAASRQQEMALRASLGAGRWRLIRQLITEGLLLALAGAALGGLGAWWCLRLLDRAATPFVPRFNPIGIDGTVLLFSLALSVLTAVLFGLAPALQLSRTQFNESLKAVASRGESGSGAATAPGRTDSRRDRCDACALGRSRLAASQLPEVAESRHRSRFAQSADDEHQPAGGKLSWPCSRRFFDELLERIRRTPGWNQRRSRPKSPWKAEITDTLSWMAFRIRLCSAR